MSARKFYPAHFKLLQVSYHERKKKVENSALSCTIFTANYFTPKPFSNNSNGENRQGIKTINGSSQC